MEEENENGELVIKKEHLDKLAELKQEKDRVERELKTLSSSITEELKTKYYETTKVGEYNFIVKGGFYDLEFDLDRFIDEQFELYCKYLKPHLSKQQFTLQSATRGKKE